MKRIDGEVLLEVKDDGIGCKELKSGFGLFLHLLRRHVHKRQTGVQPGNNPCQAVPQRVVNFPCKVNMSDYVGYYTFTSQQWLFCIWNTMISLNIILFVGYCFSVINLHAQKVPGVIIRPDPVRCHVDEST